MSSSLWNQQPLAAALALAYQPSLSEPRLVGDWVLWLERRPQEQGRTTALIRPWRKPEIEPQELTPAPANLRSRVHNYGGGALAEKAEGDELLLVWTDDWAGCLISCRWRGLLQPKKRNGAWLEALGEPVSLTPRDGVPLAAGFIDHRRHRWVGMMENCGRDLIVTVPLDKRSSKSLSILHRPVDFAGYPCLRSDGKYIAWVEWQQPSMPWEASTLWYSEITGSGALGSPKCYLGCLPSQKSAFHNVSVFQPLWLLNGQLAVAEDSSGWWNPVLLSPCDSTLRRPWKVKVECGIPQWTYGMRTLAAWRSGLLAACCSEGCWQLRYFREDGIIETLSQPFDDLTGLYVLDDRAVAIASSPDCSPGLLELDLTSKTWTHSLAAELPTPPDTISQPEAIWFNGHNGERTHAWYYPPRSANLSVGFPLLVKSHSGPTAMASCGLNLSIQFWTSRGWGIVDVNYGGSTGFGRSYRERLRFNWGVTDVQDCVAAARYLIANKGADASRVAIEGSSAGGFTALACLCFSDIFQVGACRYGISDLASMACQTHRFEAGYLEWLLGPWPEQRQLYLARSPLYNVERISCPVIFFQGLQDKVVIPEQTNQMAVALRERDIPVEVHNFPDEGHGFRDSNVLTEVLESTESFFRQHLGL